MIYLNIILFHNHPVAHNLGLPLVFPVSIFFFLEF